MDTYSTLVTYAEAFLKTYREEFKVPDSVKLKTCFFGDGCGYMVSIYLEDTGFVVCGSWLSNGSPDGGDSMHVLGSLEGHSGCDFSYLDPPSWRVCPEDHAKLAAKHLVDYTPDDLWGELWDCKFYVPIEDQMAIIIPGHPGYDKADKRWG